MCVILIYIVIYCAYSDRLEWPACVSGGWWWVSLLKTAQIIRSRNVCLVEDLPRFRQSCGLYSSSTLRVRNSHKGDFVALFGAQSQSCLGWNDSVAQAALLRQGHRMMAQNTEWWHRLMACAELEGDIRIMDSSSWAWESWTDFVQLGFECPHRWRLHLNPSGSLWQCLTAWNTRLKIILLLAWGATPKTNPPHSFSI